MTGVSIPSTVTQIGGSAFADCVSLESAIIPKSIALIYDDAFSGSLKLTNLVIEEDNQALNVGYHAAGGQGAFAVLGRNQGRCEKFIHLCLDFSQPNA